MRHHLAIRPSLWAATTAALLVTSTAHAQDDVAVITALVEAHNKERAKENLPPLKLAPMLVEAAKGHAKDMADRDVMGHEGADGSTPTQRMVRAGYHYQTTGENVAKGYETVAEVMQCWIDSPPHKKNVLGDFTELGIARAFSKDGKPYWCVDFGRPIPVFDAATAAADLVKKLNDERSTAKLPPFVVDPKLADAAKVQAVALAKRKGAGGTPNQFEGVDERRYKSIAMSTMTGQPDPEAVVKTLLDSPAHKPHVLGKFTKVGVGYATDEDGTPHWCLILATPAGR